MEAFTAVNSARAAVVKMYELVKAAAVRDISEGICYFAVDTESFRPAFTFEARKSARAGAGIGAEHEAKSVAKLVFAAESRATPILKLRRLMLVLLL